MDLQNSNNHSPFASIVLLINTQLNKIENFQNFIKNNNLNSF